MANSTRPPVAPIAAPPPGGADRRIAPAILGLMVAIVLAGFAKNFYLRAWLGTRVLIPTAWVHGFVMSAWLGLFVIQVVLARGRLSVHRRLGQWGLLLAAVVVVVGLLTIAVRTGLMYPAAAPALSAAVFVAFDGLSLLLFGALVATAYHYRREPRVHRRLMAMAMVALLPPAFGRLVAYMRHDHVQILVLELMTATVLACVLVDALRTRQVQPASVVPALLIVAVNVATYLAQVST